MKAILTQETLVQVNQILNSLPISELAKVQQIVALINDSIEQEEKEEA